MKTNRFNYIEYLRTILAYDTLHKIGLNPFLRMRIQKEVSNTMGIDNYDVTPNKELLDQTRVLFISSKIKENNWERPIDYRFDEDTRTFTPIY